LNCLLLLLLLLLPQVDLVKSRFMNQPFDMVGSGRALVCRCLVLLTGGQRNPWQSAV
jgi:hypothetical protein